MVTILIVTLFFSCESDLQKVKKLNETSFVPSGEADTLNLKYTDSGKIKSILVSQKMLDYSTIKNPFTEFPKGVKVSLYDPKGNITTIVANYAISYKKTAIIDLQGTVIITSHEGKKLETSQLYFDQKNEWFFTEQKFKFTDAKGVSFGEGIDFSKDFKRVNSQRINGEIDQTE